MTSDSQQLDQPPTGFSSVQAKWEAAGARLASAMSEYLSSCLALDHACTVPRTPLAKLDLAATITQGLESLEKSSTLPLATSPAYLIPPEILTRIFHLVVDRRETTLPLARAMDRGRDTVERVSSVCSYWRHVALETKHLWSAVYLTRHSSIEQVQRWLERSGNAPLSVMSDVHGPAPWPFVPVLRPYASHFTTLNLSCSEIDNIHTILNCWLDFGTPGSVTELSIQFTRDSSPSLSFAEVERLFGPSTILGERLDEFLRQIRMLRLKDIWLDWDSVAFEGLVELRIELGYRYGDDYITITELSRILSASPELHTLELIGIIIDPGEPGETVPPASIALHDLRTVYLQGLSTHSMDRFLRALAPGSYDIELDITKQNMPSHMNSDLWWRLPSSLGANVTVVRLGKIIPGQLHAFLSSLPNLRELYLWQRTWLTETTLQAMVRPHSTTNSTFPNIQVLRIFRGIIFDRTAFRNMIASHSLKKLTLGGHTIRPAYNDEPQSVPLESQDQLCQELASRIPDFRFYDLDKWDIINELMPRSHWRMW
ncbi:hypothetical protein BDV93DRAFT_527161 [Ceratobasidium sp. AG-I]|nr:hypothetical protein BDV93DRAFT_527161 [Ceratobasidium sp. AG-I]